MAAAISVTPLVPYNRKRRPSAVKLRCYNGVEEDRKQWEKFYKRHQNKFFKDRHYLEKDWGHYFCHPKVLLESHPNFRKDQINVFVCNIAEENLCDHIMPASVDIVTLVFTLSAVSPEKMPIIIQNLGLVLKPNGHVLFRDYAIGDYAQTMLMNKNQVISENFYFRGDGTCSYYFSEDFLSRLFERAGFVVVDVNTYNKEIINRARNITMQRRWIRAVFRRP
ncbi:tRNA N(3)-methylcytidine methyltransferase METTL6 isoform X4 [Helianthus annuus]|uniref:tRNA N(3)-methylcytidine methyltransferase METTL6 isoform X4 n=1 Tax=Helianthus annuus TaxID=4232 RepID=UPI000B8FA502|nr:tRNA N(3)-methylcytidine methyltransferase METTL6 isoform X4 [Helianthus annuus]